MEQCVLVLHSYFVLRFGLKINPSRAFPNHYIHVEKVTFHRDLLRCRE